MSRIKLFGFFAIMALVSLFRPKLGRDLIEMAEQGDAERVRRKHVAAVMGNARRVSR